VNKSKRKRLERRLPWERTPEERVATMAELAFKRRKKRRRSNREDRAVSA